MIIFRHEISQQYMPCLKDEPLPPSVLDVCLSLKLIEFHEYVYSEKEIQPCRVTVATPSISIMHMCTHRKNTYKEININIGKLQLFLKILYGMFVSLYVCFPYEIQVCFAQY